MDGVVQMIAVDATRITDDTKKKTNATTKATATTMPRCSGKWMRNDEPSD